MMKRKRIGLRIAFMVGLMILTMLTFNPKPVSSHRITEYKVLSAAEGLDPRPLNIALSFNRSYVYFTEEYTGRIGAMEAQERGDGGRRFVEYVLPFKPELGYSEPWDLDVILGSSGEKLFYTDYHQNQIGRLEIGSGPPMTLYTWDIPTSGSGPRGIFAVNEDLVWFTEYYSGKIGKLYYSGGWKFTEYTLPAGSNPVEVIFSSRDNSVWYTDYSRDKIGMLNATTETLCEYSLSGGSRPWGITMDPDGMIWFAASGGSGYIGKLNPWTREVTEYRGIPTSYSRPRDIALDNHTGTVWFTEHTGHRIGLLVPGENLFYEFPTLTPSSSPSGIAVLRKLPTNETLNIYFTEWSGNRIGHLYYGGPEVNYGATTTKTASQLTTAVTNTLLAGTIKPTAEPKEVERDRQPANIGTTTKYTATSLNGTTTVRSDTAYRLSTSTMGTSTSYITEVVYTSTTSTSTSYRYVSTVSLTSTNITVSTSTSYVATSSITYTTTFHETVYTSTMSLTSTSTVSRTDTLTTTVYYTRYRSTTSATTTTTETQVVPYTNTRVERVTLTSTVTPVTTPVTTPTTVVTTTTPMFTFPFNISCLIATAAYGSEVSPVVQYLRDFRDNLVMHTFAGSSFMRAFNAWYYSFSPYIADIIRPSPALRTMVRLTLYPLFAVLKLSAAAFHGLSWVNPEFAIVAAGLLASALIGLIYDTPLILAGLLYAGRKKPLHLKYRWLTPIPAIIGLSLIGVASAGLIGSTTLMMASTAALVLSTMTGSAMATAFLITRKISQNGKK
jgi:peptide/nickel transport system substrate-binding protein